MSRTIKSINLTTINDFYDKTQRQMREAHQKIEKAKKDAVNEAAKESARRVEQAKKDMQRQMDVKVEGVRAEVRNQLDAMDRNHRKQMQRMTDTIYARMDGIKRDIDTRFERQQSEINAVKADVQSLFDRIKKTENASQLAVEVAQTQLRQLEARIDVDRFAAETAEKVRRHIDNIEGAPTAESRIAAAHQAMQETFDLEEEAIKEKLKHDALVEFTLTQLESVIRVVNQNRMVTVTDAEGNEVEIETNYWTHGEHAQMSARMAELQAELADRYAPTLTAERIDEINKEIAEVEVRIKNMAEETVKSAVLSERRVEVTQDIVECLIEQGWTIKQEHGTEALGYMGGDEEEDMREGFFAILQNPTLDQEITVIVNPAEKAQDNQLIIQRNDVDPNRSSAEYMTQLASILRQIEKSGYRAGSPSEPATGGDEPIGEITNVGDLTRKGAAQRVRARM